MPAPQMPTTTEIKDRIISDIESYIGQSTPILPKAFNIVLAKALAGVFTILYRFALWAIDQIFTVTQDEDSLITKGNQYGIIRKPAVQAVAVVGFTGDNGAVIPEGTQFRGNLNGLVYQLQSALTIAAGVASGNLICLTSGSDGTLLAGNILTIISPIAGINNTGTVSSMDTDGSDQEDIEDYRARIQTREKLQPQGGSLVDYITWALEVADITRAFAWGKREVAGITAGYIYVYPVTDNEASRVPSAGKLLEVHDYIDDPSRAPMQAVEIVVLGMTERTFDITVTDLSPDTSAIRTEFETNLAAYLLEREPKQFTNQIDVKNVVSRSGIESIAINSGADSITLTVDINVDGTIEAHTLAYNELAILGSVTYT